MNLPFLFSAWLLVTPLLAAELPTLSPTGRITSETPSLETAYPDEMYILRTPWVSGKLVHYEVRVYSPRVLSEPAWMAKMDQIRVISFDSHGFEVSSSQVRASETRKIPPSQEAFRSFYFSVPENLESTTAVHLGDCGLRVVYRKYRLPLKTIDHPKAHR